MFSARHVHICPWGVTVSTGVAAREKQKQVGELLELGALSLWLSTELLSYRESEINYRKQRHLRGEEVADQSFWMKEPH